jgi:hypothetical protein
MAKHIIIKYGTGERPICPAELLWKAVISRAIRDFFDCTVRLSDTERDEAKAYIEADQDFIEVCRLASLNPVMIRRRFAMVSSEPTLSLARSSMEATLSFVMGTMGELEYNQRIRRNNGKGKRRDRSPVGEDR